MSRIVRWREGDPEDSLWVCVSCGAELNSDCVGKECPACGILIEDSESEDEVAGTPTLPREGKAQDTLAEIFEPTIPISVEYFLNERMGAATKQLDQEIVADFGAAMRADFEGSPSRTYDGILRMEESKHGVEAGGAAGEDRRTIEAVSKGNDGVESGAVGVREQKGVDG